MSESDTSNYTEGGWIQWFCNLEDHHFYVEIDLEYIRDNFNLYGIKKYVSNFEFYKK